MNTWLPGCLYINYKILTVSDLNLGIEKLLKSEASVIDRLQERIPWADPAW